MIFEKIGARCFLRDVEVQYYEEESLTKIIHERLSKILADEIIRKLPVNDQYGYDQFNPGKVYMADVIVMDEEGLNRYVETIQDEVYTEKLEHYETKKELLRLQKFEQDILKAVKDKE